MEVEPTKNKRRRHVDRNDLWQAGAIALAGILGVLGGYWAWHKEPELAQAAKSSTAICSSQEQSMGRTGQVVKGESAAALSQDSTPTGKVDLPPTTTPPTTPSTLPGKSLDGPLSSTNPRANNPGVREIPLQTTPISVGLKLRQLCLGDTYCLHYRASEASGALETFRVLTVPIVAADQREMLVVEKISDSSVSTDVFSHIEGLDPFYAGLAPNQHGSWRADTWVTAGKCQ